MRRVDPLSYGIDSLRGAIIGSAQFGMVNDAVILVTIALVVLGPGAWSFSKIQV